MCIYTPVTHNTLLAIVYAKLKTMAVVLCVTEVQIHIMSFTRTRISAYKDFLMKTVKTENACLRREITTQFQS
jgi:hypothetical protein